MTNKKLKILLEVIIMIGLTVYISMNNVIPELKRKFGSSDKLISYLNYSNMFEININNNTDFILVLNKNYKIYHIIFLSDNISCLYNKNLENYEDNNKAINHIVELLIENNLLKSNYNIEVTKYNRVYYEKFMNYFTSSLKKYNVSSSIVEKENTIIDKANSLNLDSTSEQDALLKLDYYSKKIISRYKNNISTSSIDSTNTILDEDTYKSYSNNIYKKLEKYVYSNKITTLDKNNAELIISSIPADDRLEIYPTSNSWYYVSNGRVYAYIEFNNSEKIYNFCYNGSIDGVESGVC